MSQHATGLLERLRAGFRELLALELPHLDFLALYRCEVVAQNPDDTLELKPEDARVPSLKNVPIWVGVPGVRVKVSQGAQVLLGFHGGSPAAPYAALWGSEGLVEVQVSASSKVVVNAPQVLLGDGTAAVARVGDGTSPTAAMALWIAGVTTVVNGVAPGSAVAPTGAITTITAGSGKVKA